ncbi:lysozyme C-1/C-2-like [Hypanus sabinus]|uniref:lysozyme C-1/C-2-like n=1 Tax=Hypanus sabinus TaxID=79690 RepID=UPI0028C41813|nr:lysozyme C-1/C-2-like [Hypanus sabinus]XP_059822022.1 lysozyme C-1/C-2-like [Hypanus sabinus]
MRANEIVSTLDLLWWSTNGSVSGYLLKQKFILVMTDLSNHFITADATGQKIKNKHSLLQMRVKSPLKVVVSCPCSTCLLCYHVAIRSLAGVCLANYESAFQTNAIHYERNSAGNIWSADFGIFQINSYWWCYEPGFPSAGNGCNVYCQDLYDVQTAINCAAIVAEQQGMKAWVSWVDNCEGRSIQHFVEGC